MLKTNDFTWFHWASDGTNHIVNPSYFIVAMNVHFHLSSVLGENMKRKSTKLDNQTSWYLSKVYNINDRESILTKFISY